MATIATMTSYYVGEPLIVDATLTDDDGAAITSGTMTLRVAPVAGGVQVASATGTHSGGGVWRFQPGDVSGITAGRLHFDITDASGFVLVWGSLLVGDVARAS